MREMNLGRRFHENLHEFREVSFATAICSAEEAYDMNRDKVVRAS